MPWMSAIGVTSPGAGGCAGGSLGSLGSVGALPEPCGVGAVTSKSAALLSVSTPASLRWTEVLLEVPFAGAPSKFFAPPQPTRSTWLPEAS